MLIVGIVLTIGIVIRYCPHIVGFDTVWRRENTARHLNDLAAKIENHPQDDAALQELIGHAQSTYHFERDFAIGTLGKLGGKAVPAIPTIADALGSSDSFTRGAAARALYHMGENAAPAKTELIQLMSTHPSEGAARYAVEALGRIGDSSPDVLDALRATVLSSSRDVYAREEARRVYEELTGQTIEEN